MLAADFDQVPVQQWLQRMGATLVVDAYGPQAVFAGDTGAVTGGDTIVPLPDLGVIEVSGADAVKFLHGQLTQSVEALGEDQWKRFGYCNAKGRLQLTALGSRDGEQVRLICSRPLAAPLAKRLGMFVLRAKAKVTEVSAGHEIYAVSGPATALREALGLADAPAGTRKRFTHEGLEGEAFYLSAGTALSVQGLDFGAPPLLLLRVQAGSPLWQLALSKGLKTGNSQHWRITEVASAVGRIVPATYECFVPQMINFESVGGVDFKKGCYPGQEVVARSQYLGKLKRRAHVGWIASSGATPAFEPLPAQDVWLQEASEPSGQVVLAGRAGALGVGVLFEVAAAALEQGPVGVRDEQQQWHAIEVLPLPYALLEI